ncbi:MAG: hypothetical protein RL885_14720 [Planctomycetota bacterium]
MHRLIFEDGEIVELSEGKWSGEDPDLVEMCAGLAESFREDRPGYHPDEASAIAEYVAEALGLELESDGGEPDTSPTGLIY